MRLHTTMFLLTSIDGKISTGTDFTKDFDKDIPNMKYASKGLEHYYEAEKTTSIWSINSGAVMKKMYDQNITCRSRIFDDDVENIANKSLDVNFIIFDNSHLNEDHILWLCKKAWPAKCVIFYSKQHIALDIYNKSHNMLKRPHGWEEYENLEVYCYSSLEDAFNFLNEHYHCTEVTIQTGCTLNAEFLKRGLVDSLDLVVAPFVVGSNAINMVGELKIPTEFKLDSVENLGDSYVRIKYDKIAE